MRSVRQDTRSAGTSRRWATLRSVRAEGAGLRPAEVWDRHGPAAYALASALLGDEAAATQAVTLAMTDLARSEDTVPAETAHRTLSRHVYARSQELVDQTFRTLDLPPAMVWLGKLAPLQRACLALCVFGGLTHQEAAELVDVPPMTVAELLTAGLRDLSGLAAAEFSGNG
ncbi:MAG: hypothetical protein AVDCRST_MAG32-1526 [uncultured Nocardioides sp.]|uniref:RNA polymerase sigma factor 70 region 4 type 2 domain-containing protein n=1 Tax=uncultured Nocardioides sp. TaxID=198441 RepID=A0A6J4N567_9ACTN|nr:MAG: hypothetical protein AVDCRST_MAG32-1526 [uncultured Nocardioides sp.]